MVYLRLIKADADNWKTTQQHLVMINPNETTILNFTKVKIQKSNGQWHEFDVLRSDTVYRGDISLPDVLRRKYSFHLNNTYLVQGYCCSTLQKNPTLDISKIGVLGQNAAIDEIMWSVFEPRKLPLKDRLELNLKLVRGVILYGPPGTGKTSMIRGICNYHQIAPNVVDGPQLLNAYIGKAEDNIRDLFFKPMADQIQSGNESPLHVIVIDEIDALFPKRSTHSGETDTRNTVVSQMLSMMDGYTLQDNYVIFGTTNRLDMIDTALLHAGRFELHIKIDLPDTQGRFDILNFLTKPLLMNGRLASDVNEVAICRIAQSTVNYSGAELKQLIESATRLAVQRVVTGSEIDINGKHHTGRTKIVVEQSDINHALQIHSYERYLAEKKEPDGVN